MMLVCNNKYSDNIKRGKSFRWWTPCVLAALGPRSLWGERRLRLASSRLHRGAGVAGRCKACGYGMGALLHTSLVVQYSAVQYSEAWCSAVQYSEAWFSIV